ncbi:ATPase P-type K/Mg/Cd/Cu/Zn/Na/Ca/Na/H-transporter [Penicillium cf. griseofulvum]|nr:ATPase P-type K/Mg/Cd/Cu/Zn/Na/Ca/Na/H-transporter [Penicillium cf. griseofulvum]
MSNDKPTEPTEGTQPNQSDGRISSQHVRFSTDLDRESVEEQRQTNRDQRPNSRGLTIDTALAPPSVRPAPSPTSPLSPPNATQNATLSWSPESAGRSRSRNRGYSLRRSIFNKTINSTETNDVALAELGEVKEPSSDVTPAQAPTTESLTAADEKHALSVAPTATLDSTHKDDASHYVSSDPSERPLKGQFSVSVAHDKWRQKKATTAVAVARFQAVMTSIQKFILRIKDIPPTKDGRHIDLNPSMVGSMIDERTGKPYIGNYIRSSRYSLWSFFPRQFFAQFTKVANFYFLVVAILQMIPGLSTTGTYTTMVPLVGLRCGIKCEEIRVGDIIRLERDQPMPADIALLHAEGPNGVAYIETMALDGETNFKNKQPCQPVSKACATVEDISSNSIHFAVEDPNLDLYKFDGHVSVNGQERLPLTNNEIVYRGSILRNTDHALGMVIYTGEECKIRMNANKNPRIKSPSLQAKVNRVVMLIVVLVVALAVVCTIAYKYCVDLGPIFTSFLIMFNTMIPISLYVSMEIVKVAQMFLLNDIDMYDQETDTPLEARTSTINEELGQVSYVFSDKTGTLTNNTMRFRKMTQTVHRLCAKGKLFLLSIALCHTCIPEEDGNGDTSYQASSPDELALVLAARELGYLVQDRQSNNLTIRTRPNGPYEPAIDESLQILEVIEFSSARKRMRGQYSDASPKEVRSGTREGRLRLRGAASRRKDAEVNWVIRRNSEHNNRKESGFSRGLACTPLMFGYAIGKRTTVSRNREAARFTALDLRLNLVDPQLRSQTLSSMNERSMRRLVEEALVVNETAVFERCFQHLNDFATDGLRTFLYGHRYLDEATYENWKKAYHEACTSLVDRQEKIEKVGEEIEQQLELTGATAIEDKLQKGVPEAIDKLRRANIKLWMLTGDKRETAINENGDVEQTIVKLTAEITKGFFQLAILVDSVICCRASPKQKAFFVRSIRLQVKDAVTLAIGDGANDIAMIQEAHVGIGITGKEGLQAARISDYSIAQFRFLLKLLLVHGRWNYIRACKYTLGTFWKEMLFYLTQALYQRWNGYTGTSLYESWSLSMFNTLFTSLAVIFLGIFTKDLAAPTLLAVPELYNKGQRHAGFNIKLYLGWTFMAACEAMIIYFTIDNDIYSMGLVTFSACVVVINTKLQALEVHNKTYLSLDRDGYLSRRLVPLEPDSFDREYTMSSGKGVYFLPSNFLQHSGHNLLLLGRPPSLHLSSTPLRIRRLNHPRLFFPTDVDIFQEYEQDLDIRRRFEEAAALELQQGWDRGTKRSSFEIAREKAELAEIDARERHVRELLARPRVMDSKPETKELEMDGYTSASATASHSGSVPSRDVVNGVDAETDRSRQFGLLCPEAATGHRRSVEIQELFSKGWCCA